MRRIATILTMLWAPFAAAYEETLKIPGSPELRVALGPRDVAESYGYVDSEFVLRLQLVSAFAFEALTFNPPVIENARLIRILTPRTKAVTTYAGSGYIFETAYAIFAERPGELVIPPLVATGVIEPEPGQPTPFRSETLEQRIEIRDAPPEFQGDTWVVTSRVRFDEVWSKPPEEAVVGDILRREVTLTAFGVEAERLPELTLTGSTGAVVSDHGGGRETLLSTDGVIGKVTRAWDIRIADPRVAVIGPVAIEHWHPSYHRSIRAEAPAYRLEPAPADPDAQVEALLADAAEGQRAWRAAGIAVAGLILSPLAAGLFSLLRAAAPTAADLRLRRALSGRPAPQEAWLAVDRWASDGEIELDDAGENYLGLSRALFAHSGEANDFGQMRADLLAMSRRVRIEKMRDRAGAWLSAIIGHKSSLQD